MHARTFDQPWPIIWMKINSFTHIFSFSLLLTLLRALSCWIKNLRCCGDPFAEVPNSWYLYFLTFADIDKLVSGMSLAVLLMVWSVFSFVISNGENFFPSSSLRFPFPSDLLSYSSFYSYDYFLIGAQKPMGLIKNIFVDAYPTCQRPSGITGIVSEHPLGARVGYQTTLVPSS